MYLGYRSKAVLPYETEKAYWAENHFLPEEGEKRMSKRFASRVLLSHGVGGGAEQRRGVVSFLSSRK